MLCQSITVVHYTGVCMLLYLVSVLPEEEYSAKRASKEGLQSNRWRKGDGRLAGVSKAEQRGTNSYTHHCHNQCLAEELDCSKMKIFSVRHTRTMVYRKISVCICYQISTVVAGQMCVWIYNGEANVTIHRITLLQGI